MVKELVENSLDAGAARIEIELEAAGTELIRIVDDGCGIAAEDMPFAFAKNATSKLSTADDLFKISTLGFRGEALAAIAEISRVRCQTRQPGSHDGCEITIDGGVAGPILPASCNVGTVIEVTLLSKVDARRRPGSNSVSVFMNLAAREPQRQ